VIAGACSDGEQYAATSGLLRAFSNVECNNGKMAPVRNGANANKNGLATVFTKCFFDFSRVY